MLLQTFFLLLAVVIVKACDSNQQSNSDRLSGDQLKTRQNACVLSPESIEGPYHIDKLIERSDVTDGELGIPLDLTFLIRDSKTCDPLPNVIVDLWNCNATGFYSGFLSRGNGFKVSRGVPTDDSRFLRGIQITNANDEVKFKTIYPGWYVNRAVHIHIKIFCSMDTTTAKYTGQFYFNEEVNEAVSNAFPYCTSPVIRTLNSADALFISTQGTQTTLQVTGSDVAGFTAKPFVIGIKRPEASISAAFTQFSKCCA